MYTCPLKLSGHDAPCSDHIGQDDITGRLRTIAYISGDALSGGLQLASAFRHVFAAPAARLGSVKVRAISAHHPDVTLAVAGTYTEGAFGEIEDAAERVRVQQHAALEHEMFRDLLARYRGLSFEEVCEKFGDGAIYSADEAARRGMVDAVMTKAELRAWLASEEQSEKARAINPRAD